MALAEGSVMLAVIVLNNLAAWPWAAAVAAVGIALTLFVYPAQWTNIHRAAASVVFLARAAAVIGVATIILQPSILRARRPEELGGVVLLVDRSASMAIADAPTDPASVVDLAEGMGMLPPVTTPRPTLSLLPKLEALRNLAGDLSLARGDVEYAQLIGQSADAADARLHAAATLVETEIAEWRKLGAPESVVASLERLDALARAPVGDNDTSTMSPEESIDALAAALDAAKRNENDHLYRSNPLIRSACEKLRGISRFALAERALFAKHKGLLARLDPSVTVYGFTFADTTSPLVVDRGGGESHIRAIADGASSDIESAITNAERTLGDKPIAGVVVLTDGCATSPLVDHTAGPAVFPVLIAGPTRRDVSVAGVDVPKRARVGELVNVRVRLAATAARGSRVDVKASCDDVAISRTVQIGDEASVAINLPLRMNSAGPQTIVVDANITPADFAANNRVTRVIEVSDAKLVVDFSTDGSPDAIDLRTMLRKALWVRLRENGSMSGDVLVLFNPPPESRSEAEWSAIADRVKAGASCVLVLSDPAIAQRWADSPAVAALMPIQFGAVPAVKLWPGDEPAIGLRRTEAAKADGLLSLAEEPAVDARRWTSVVGSRVVTFPNLKPTARALVAERDGGAAVMTEMALGTGRAFAIGYGETWRWRRRGGEREQTRFWIELMHYAAPTQFDMSVGELSIDVPAKHAVNLPIDLSARCMSAGPTPRLTIESAAVALPLAAALVPIGPPGSGTYRASIEGLPVGRYAAVLRDDGGHDVRAAFEVTSSLELELAAANGDAAAMEKLTRGNGGQVVRLSELRTLPKLIEDARRKRSGTIEYPLWCSPYLFAFIVGCLGIEWATRKGAGLL